VRTDSVKGEYAQSINSAFKVEEFKPNDMQAQEIENQVEK
jgi:hypothetical protein